MDGFCFLGMNALVFLECFGRTDFVPPEITEITEITEIRPFFSLVLVNP